jgi:hypothetical protein
MRADRSRLREYLFVVITFAKCFMQAFWEGPAFSFSRLPKKSLSRPPEPRCGICARLATAKPRRQTYIVTARVSAPAVAHLFLWKPPLR